MNLTNFTKENTPVSGLYRIAPLDETHVGFRHRTTISYIIPTLNRPSFEQTIRSIQFRLGDEALVYYRQPPAKTWGYTERNEMIPYARGSWLAFIDDDDQYAPGYLDAFEDAIAELPGGQDVPIIFRMKFPNGKVLWDEPKMINANVGTPMLLIPNQPRMLAKFNETRYVGDFDFLNCLKWPRRKYVWRPEITVLVGNAPRGGTVRCDGE